MKKLFLLLLLSLGLISISYAGTTPSSVWEDNGVSPNVAKQLSSVGANSNANWTADLAFQSTTVSNDPYKVDQVLDDGFSHYIYIVSIDRFLSKDFKKVRKYSLHEKIKSIGEQISQILIEHPNAVFGISLKGGGNSFYKSPEGITRGYFLTAWEKDLEVRKAFQEVWRLISEDLKHISENNLVFNIINEPEFEYMKAWNKREIWEEWSTEIVDVIRSVSPDRTLIIEGMHKGLWARYDGPENLLLPIDRTNIVYGFHYYQHAEWAFQDTQGWMQGVSGNPMPYNYEQEVKAHMNQLIRYSEKYNVPVVLSEIGVNGQCDGNGPVPEDRAKYVSVVYDTLIPANIGITWWAIESPPNSPYQRVSGNCYRNIDKKLIPDEALFKVLNLIGTGPDVTKIIFELKDYDEALDLSEDEFDLSTIKASDEFDGKYAFKLISNPPNITKHQIGSGYFEIKSGFITVSTKDRVLIASSNKFVTNKYYNKFEGRIDANGEIQANFFFNPCANGSKCYVQEEGKYNIAINDDKNITISGNIKTHKLTGEFTKGSGPDVVKIIFEIEAN